MSEAVRTHMPPEGVEERRQVDPQRTGLSMEAHAARALNRFSGPKASTLDSTVTRDFTEGDSMRNKIEELLEKRELRDPINIERFVSKHFEAAKALNTVKEEDKPFPSVEDAIRNFTDLSPEELEDINQMRNPVFQLLPITSSERNLKDLNGNKPTAGQIDVCVSPWAKGALERADARDNVTDSGETIVGWNIAITEGTNAPDVLKGDDVDRTLENRLAWFQSTHPNRGIDFTRYMKLQQAGFAKNPARPVDDYFERDGTWTMLNGEPTHNGCVASGRWDAGGRRVYLVRHYVEFQDAGARFRLSVIRRCV
ncbi:hypothetical protein HZC20_01545 [Candidatus Peregrinibacteria bacterium]|nr:hypothetical protein [Candidatus Peregrinibacteria bacterium]